MSENRKKVLQGGKLEDIDNVLDSIGVRDIWPRMAAPMSNVLHTLVYGRGKSFLEPWVTTFVPY